MMLPDEIISSVQQSSRVGRWKIRRCIVLGGLSPSITSLVIVTAATMTNMSDGNIVIFALTNLIAGVFIVRHDVSRLLEKKRRMNEEGRRIEVEGGNGYKEVLKEKMYCVLHFMIALLSFLFFGLVPPLVYAVGSSLKIRKGFKIMAAAGASLSCTAFLAIQKAHINQNPTNWPKTAAVYVSLGIGALAIAYVAACMFEDFLHGLFL